MFLPGVAPYALSPDEKSSYLLPRLRELVEYHEARCAPYARLTADWRAHRGDAVSALDALPLVPATAFKEYDLRSSEAAVSVSSSSTTGQRPSRVFLDKTSRVRATLSAQAILADFVGAEKRPYLVFDAEETVRGGALSARGAAILSLAHFAEAFHFVMRRDGDRLVLDDAALERAFAAIGDRPFLGYGFTYVLYQAHRDLSERQVGRAMHPASVLLHSGGWKRLQDQSVDPATFNRLVSAVWQLPAGRVIDFYGLVEQMGIPYPDCAAGVKHVPYWADVVIRRADTLAPAATGETGLIQLLNCLPTGSPSHSVLTEDLGVLALEDGCACGRRGRAFVFKGRAPRAELRGCSNVMGVREDAA